jgi:hypothetical protein
MTRRKASEKLETNAGNCEVTLHAIWPLAKCLMKRNKSKALTAIHDPSGL